ncbi:UPF0158 family protein [Gordonia sp. CPCC 205515]|uniref:UPF0158 family protein n=1 Tax=Gordonia sp. CPCC 205515 TaxID=3140791 RepID=UPI003AF383E1
MAAEKPRDLAAAVYRADGRDVVAVLNERLWDDVLQLTGDGLLLAVAQSVDGAIELARDCAAKLREREWYGDEELADLLEAAVGDGPTPALRSAPIDLEDLAGILEGDPMRGGGRIDLQTGQVYPDEFFDDADLDDLGLDEDALEEPDRWLNVDCAGSRQGFRDMTLFIESLADEALAEKLRIAINGRGAFRRFRDVLWDTPESMQWQVFSDERKRGRAREWLAGAGYRPSIKNLKT